MNDKIARVMLVMFIIAAAVLGPRVSLGWAQIASPPPAVAVRDKNLRETGQR